MVTSACADSVVFAVSAYGSTALLAGAGHFLGVAEMRGCTTCTRCGAGTNTERLQARAPAFIRQRMVSVQSQPSSAYAELGVKIVSVMGLSSVCLALVRRV